MVKTNNKFRADFIFNLGKLLENGFSLTSCLKCLKIKYKNKTELIDGISDKLNTGNMLSESLSELNLTNSMEEQLYFAEKNGFLRSTLKQIGQLLHSRNQ